MRKRYPFIGKLSTVDFADFSGMSQWWVSLWIMHKVHRGNIVPIQTLLRVVTLWHLCTVFLILHRHDNCHPCILIGWFADQSGGRIYEYCRGAVEVLVGVFVRTYPAYESLCVIFYITSRSALVMFYLWGSHSTVVACWTAGQCPKWSILHLGYDSWQSSS